MRSDSWQGYSLININNSKSIETTKNPSIGELLISWGTHTRHYLKLQKRIMKLSLHLHEKIQYTPVSETNEVQNNANSVLIFVYKEK